MMLPFPLGQRTFEQTNLEAPTKQNRRSPRAQIYALDIKMVELPRNWRNKELGLRLSLLIYFSVDRPVSYHCHQLFKDDLGDGQQGREWEGGIFCDIGLRLTSVNPVMGRGKNAIRSTPNVLRRASKCSSFFCYHTAAVCL